MPQDRITETDGESLRPPSVRTELALTLRRWRKEAGQTQTTVGRSLHIAQTTLSRYENPDGQNPAPVDAIRLLWEHYRLPDDELANALGLRAQVEGEAPGAARTRPDEPSDDGPAEPREPAATAAATTATASEPATRTRHWPLWCAAALVLAAAAIAVPRLAGDDSPASETPTSPAAAVPPRATPAVACDASSCTGIEPAATTCLQDASTTARNQAYGVLIELRFSPSCRAAWARMSGSSPDDRVQVFDRNGAPSDQQEYRQQYGHDAHTKMVHSARPTDATACAVVVSRGTVCTGDATTAPTPSP
ncbi:DUF2690 domain-containing protein [Kitasatospora sp. NPDC005856]|uniref:helix-turn-helix domain-containing protein n=1 Tax=Kitasatospora sp. NPDC005856 TaxID=3154566 RepID=UPI0033DCB01F